MSNVARIKVEQEGKCRNCGRTWGLEAAHTWDRSLGRSGYGEATLIVPLCGYCHVCYDSHCLDLLPVMSLAEQLALVQAAGSIERARNRAMGRPPSD